MHYGYLVKVSSWKEFSLSALYYPRCALHLGVPLKWHQVSTMFVSEVSKQLDLQNGGLAAPPHPKPLHPTPPFLLFICWLTRRDVWKKIRMLCIWLGHLIVVWGGGGASPLKCWLFNKRRDPLSRLAWILSWFRLRGLCTQRRNYFWICKFFEKKLPLHEGVLKKKNPVNTDALKKPPKT